MPRPHGPLGAAARRTARRILAAREPPAPQKRKVARAARAHSRSAFPRGEPVCASQGSPAPEGSPRVSPARLAPRTRAPSAPASSSPATKPPPKPRPGALSPRLPYGTGAPRSPRGESGPAPNSPVLAGAQPDPQRTAGPGELAHLAGAPDAVRAASPQPGTELGTQLSSFSSFHTPPHPTPTPTPRPPCPRACAPTPGPVAGGLRPEAGGSHLLLPARAPWRSGRLSRELHRLRQRQEKGGGGRWSGGVAASSLGDPFT